MHFLGSGFNCNCRVTERSSREDGKRVGSIVPEDIDSGT